jgi:uncharacterized membrane protein
MKPTTKAQRFERRWPVVLTILAVMLLLAVLPGRIRFLPMVVTYVLGIAVLVPIAGAGLTKARTRWLRAERTVTLLFFVVTAAGSLSNLANVIVAMAQRPEGITGLQLLESSVALWVTNVMTFSLLYWQLDRGGPEARVNHAGRRPDWFFPQEGDALSAAPADWRPVFVDYLYLSYSTATAFSTTDVVPLTSRAKLLMMAESTIALVTIVVVASRAINIFGGG